MKNSSNNHQYISEPKWQGITSLVLGVVSILANVTSVIFGQKALMEFWLIPTQEFPFEIEIGWLFPAVGLVLGIMGLKYTRRKLAIDGTVLCSIGLLIYIIFDVLCRLLIPW